MIKQISVKRIKSQKLSEEKKPTPSTNIPLLSLRKTEQKNAFFWNAADLELTVLIFGYERFFLSKFQITVIVSTFVTKVTDYLCWGRFFFLQANFVLKLLIFDGILKNNSKSIVALP